MRQAWWILALGAALVWWGCGTDVTMVGGGATGTTSGTTSSTGGGASTATGGTGGGGAQGGSGGGGAVGGSGGSGLSGSCDMGDCSACGQSDCAMAQCGNELSACTSSQPCTDFYGCREACAEDPNCIYDCKQDNPDGAVLYEALANCLFCDAATCSQDCGDYCPLEIAPEPPCDLGDCATCGLSSCALFWCSLEVDGCYGDPQCVAFVSCQEGCQGDPSCIQGCSDAEPDGAALYYELLNCLYCGADTCSQDCQGFCPIEPPPDPPCDVGDCSACGQSSCAQFWCGPEIDGCFGDQECVDFMDCQEACQDDPGCIVGCNSTYPNGSDLFYEMVNCLYCDVDTCSQDCQEFCPVEPPPAGPCDVGDCDACTQSTCAQFWCGPELAACYADQECIDFADCVETCGGGQICMQVCSIFNPNGGALYQAAVECIVCDPNTCSQDCAASCP